MEKSNGNGNLILGRAPLGKLNRRQLWKIVTAAEKGLEVTQGLEMK